MALWRKVMGGVLAVVVGVPLLFVGVMYASAWYGRWRAGQLLAVLKTVRPGVTTQIEYLRVVRPFEAVSYEVEIDGRARPDAVAIGNRAEWIARAFDGRRYVLDRLVDWRVIPAVAAFSVTPIYGDGVVSRLKIGSESPVSGHAPGAFVFWSASRFEPGDPRFDDDFRGYRESQMGAEGGPPWEYFVTMDERATAEERGRALDFQFRCFTRLSICKDAAMYLQPVAAQQP